MYQLLELCLSPYFHGIIHIILLGEDTGVSAYEGLHVECRRGQNPPRSRLYAMYKRCSPSRGCAVILHDASCKQFYVVIEGPVAPRSAFKAAFKEIGDLRIIPKFARRFHEGERPS